MYKLSDEAITKAAHALLCYCSRMIGFDCQNKCIMSKINHGCPLYSTGRYKKELEDRHGNITGEGPSASDENAKIALQFLSQYCLRDNACESCTLKELRRKTFPPGMGTPVTLCPIQIKKEVLKRIRKITVEEQVVKRNILQNIFRRASGSEHK